MSALVQAVAAVVATPTPVVSPDLSALATAAANLAASKAAGTPAVVVQAAQIAGVFFTALVLSVFHRIAEYVTSKEAGWGLKTNTLVATGYSVGVGVVGAASMHQLGTNVAALVALAVSTFTALSGSFWTYAVRKVLADLTGASVKTTVPVTQDSAPVLAVETPPAG